MQDLSTSTVRRRPPTRAAAALRSIDAWIPLARDRKDREMLRDAAALGMIFFLLATAAYLATASWGAAFPRDRTGLVVGRDFLNLWMYGRAVADADPARFYDVATYNAELLRLLGPGYPGQNWPNPPTALLVMAPFGLLSFFPALLTWMIAGLAALTLTVRRLFPHVRVLPLLLVSPAAVLCLISGQSSLLTTAALIGAFFCWDRRPVLAGVLIGLLTVKPQLGILIPFALAASLRWKVFASAATTAVALALLSLALFGPDIWIGYITEALPRQREVLSDPAGIAAPFHATIFMNLRGLIGNDPAAAIQLVCSVASVAAVVWAFACRRDADPVVLCALLLACTQSTSPYMSTYDLLPLTFMVLILLAQGGLDHTGRRLAQLVFWLPALQLVFGSVQLPGPGFVAPALAAYLVIRLRGAARKPNAGDGRTSPASLMRSGQVTTVGPT
jgi:hypothetical protein